MLISTIFNMPLRLTCQCALLMQALSESMYDLAHIGAQRVAKLCREPSGLACWALELLEEQACMVSTPCSFRCDIWHSSAVRVSESN